MKIILLYIVTLVVLGALDAVWITLTKSMYASHIGHLLSGKIVWWAAILFYLFYAGAIVYFAVLGSTSLSQAVLRGAILGFTAYMTYDLTNLATLSNWPAQVALMDIAWGTVLTAAVAAAASLI